MRYLIDCTFVYQHPTHNFGIQRVVRNVFHQLEKLKIAPDDELVPVIVLDDKVCAIEMLPDKVGLMTPVGLKLLIHEAVTAMDRKRTHLEERPYFTNYAVAAKVLNAVYQLVLFPLRVVFKLARVWEALWVKRKHNHGIEVGEGDVMLLLDSSWQYDFEPMLRKGKAKGMKVIAVVYDLIPISHSQFVGGQFTDTFRAWLLGISKVADGYIAISKTIRDELRAFQSRNSNLPPEVFQHFYLGAELKIPEQGLPVRNNLIRNGDERMYLTVGTLEPRKNHKYLLDAFDLLWQQGENVHLYIVGKVGWKCEDLVKRIENHPEFNKRLVFYGNANDAELVECYKAAKAVVFASHVEGFGLPLVEAWQQGTPVYASDIPVFREIGGEETCYFDLADPASLAKIISEDHNSKQAVDGSWINWQQSAQQLYDAAKFIVSSERG